MMKKDEFALIEYWKVLRKRWLLIIALPVIASLAGTLYLSRSTTPVYDANTKIIIGKRAEDQSGRELYYSDQANQQLTRTYMEIARSRTVMGRVAAKLADKPSPEALSSQISVGIIKGTELLTIDVKDSDPTRAAQIANETTDEVAKYLAEIENKDVVKVVDYAVVPKTPLAVDKTNKIALLGVLGLLSGLLLAFLLEFAGKLRSQEKK